MSAGLSTPASRWALLAGRSSHWTSTPAVGRLRQTRQPQPLVVGDLLFPVLRLGTVYQLNCVCRHCPRLPSHDSWSESASLRQHWMTCACSASDFCRAMLCISAAIAGMRCPSVRPSVCPSVTFVSCAKTNISSNFFHYRVAKPF